MKMIEEALLSIGLLIVATKLAEGVFKRFRMNSIVAYTLTGILLGPVTGIVEPTGQMQILLGIGIFLLFFLIGLDELDISSFMTAFRGRYFVAAVISVLIPLLAVMVVTSDLVYDFGLGLDFHESVSLAGILSLTSLGLAIALGLMGVINMAHGELLMIGAYATFVVQNIFLNYFLFSK